MGWTRGNPIKRAGRCALTNGGKFADSFERVNMFELCRISVALLEESQQEFKASGVRTPPEFSRGVTFVPFVPDKL